MLDIEKENGAGQPYKVSTREAWPLAKLMAEAGVSLAKILAELGLPTTLLEDGQSESFDLTDYFRILEKVSLEAQDETYGVCSRPLIPGSTQFVWSNLIGSVNLLDSMKRVAKTYNVLFGGHFNYVEIRDDAVVYVIDDRGFPYTLNEDADYVVLTMECVLVYLHVAFLLLTGDALDQRLRKIYTRRQQAANQCGPLDFFGVPVRKRSSYYALAYDLSAAEMPVSIDPVERLPRYGVYRKIIELIEDRQHRQVARHGIVQQVMVALEAVDRRENRIAKNLGMSVATLGRRLREEGTSFRDLRRIVLNTTAKELLGQGLSLPEVADSLGFSDFRSFTRAFKGWNGVTPKSFVTSMAGDEVARVRVR